MDTRSAVPEQSPAERLATYFAFSVTSVSRGSVADNGLYVASALLTRMDKGETLFKTGDCLVQRGTNHAWSNRTDKPCRVAFIFVSADAGS